MGLFMKAKIMKEKIKKLKKDDIFDELRRLMESSVFSHKILKKFNIFLF